MEIVLDRFFYNNLTQIMDSFSCSPIKYRIFIFKIILMEVPKYAEMQQNMMSLQHNSDVTCLVL